MAPRPRTPTARGANSSPTSPAGFSTATEVPKPPGFNQREIRRNKFSPRINRPPSKRREQVLELLLTTRKTEKQIADKLGLSPLTVNGHVGEIYRQHRVHKRNHLAIALGRKAPIPRQGRPSARVVNRRAQVANLYTLGVKTRQIASHLNISISMVENDLFHLHKHRLIPYRNKPWGLKRGKPKRHATATRHANPQELELAKA